MEIFKELNKKGYKHYYEGTVEELDSMDKDNQYLHSEIMQVIMWLYEKHEIWIDVNRVILGSDEWGFGYSISYLPKEFQNAKRRCSYLKIEESFHEGVSSYVGAWDLPTEAYLEAIEYALKNLI